MQTRNLKFKIFRIKADINIPIKNPVYDKDVLDYGDKGIVMIDTHTNTVWGKDVSMKDGTVLVLTSLSTKFVRINTGIFEEIKIMD